MLGNVLIVNPESGEPPTGEPEDFEFSPFNQRGGLGRASQLFADLPKLLDELNEALAA